MCSSDNEEQSLQASLKRAASAKLCVSLESTYLSGASSMADALRAAKERLAERKALLGEEAALAELDASIRAADSSSPPLLTLKARPKLWLLDRDGCLNVDVGAPGVVRAEDLSLIPGSAGAIRRLRLSGKVALITNQSARGKGLLSAETLDAIHEALRHQLATTARGGLVGREQWDALYVCEDAGPSARKKPEPGMILEALRDLGCAPGEAVMIGDSWSDVVAAHRAGCVGVLLATGHGESLGAVLAQHRVRLPTTLQATGEADTPATEFAQLQQTLGEGSDAASAVEEWIRGRSEAEASLIWEALRQDVRVYSDLSQAVDELVAVASEM